jgi:uncharacterized coiled-coil DUF342 family protein
MRLTGILERLNELNGKLRTELHDSRKNSKELSNMLASSRAELETLRTGLEDLRKNSGGLLSTAESSNQESEELRTALMKAENSLRNLELSFTAYRLKAETRIARLEKGRTILKYGLIIGSILAVSGWTAFGFSLR